MGEVVFFIVGNFTLTFFIIGLIAAGISLLRKPKPWGRALVLEEIFAFFLLFEMGIGQIYNALFHIFLGDMAAELIGWPNSPFQAEVGFASFGFGILGLLAFRGNYTMRLAAVVGPAIFFWGAAAVHVYDMIATSNFAPGNAGVIFYMDIFIPLFGFLMLWLTRPSAKQDSKVAAT